MARLSQLGVDFDHWCFACGRRNPAGMHLDFDVARHSAETTYVGQQRHQGYEGTLHGGVVAALLDETMGWAIFHQGIWGVTAKLDVTYRRPVPVGEELRVRAEVVRDRGRAIELHGTVARASDGEVLAEAAGLFLRMPDERRAELERRYSAAKDAFERVREAVAAQEAGMEHGRT
ncbi:MAG: PaaI family thioesterase [Chloroflexi bacterium]|nr:PaaI family thioesterase [Chloroflexota bacterium]